MQAASQAVRLRHYGTVVSGISPSRFSEVNCRLAAGALVPQAAGGLRAAGCGCGRRDALDNDGPVKKGRVNAKEPRS